MSTFLLDTCTISDFFAGIGHTKRKVQSISPGQIAISSITVMEVLYGFELNPSVKRKLHNAFHSLREVTKTIPFDALAAESAARIRSELRKKGTPIGSLDLLIGATALAHGCVLVTSNVREFDRIPSLIVEDWR